jgi:hypothetical protein
VRSASLAEIKSKIPGQVTKGFSSINILKVLDVIVISF